MAVQLYKEYEIKAAPYQFDDGEWSTKVYLKRQYGNASKYYIAANRFGTEAEAVDASIAFGKDIIDGKYPNLNTHDL